jgi:four helix bundle protein
MFDFEKLEVYQRAKEFNAEMALFLSKNEIDRITRDQLKRASLSVALNIAEGSSRFSKPDRKNFLVISRGSLFECIAILIYSDICKIWRQVNFRNAMPKVMSYPECCLP